MEIADEKDSVSMITREGNNIWTASEKGINVWAYASRQGVSMSISGPTRADKGNFPGARASEFLTRTKRGSQYDPSNRRSVAIGSFRDKRI